MTRVLLDCDGVLADFIGPVLDLVYLVTDRRHTHEQVDRFDFAACLDLSPDEKRAVRDVISGTEGWWRSLPVLPRAQDGVRRLREVADVYVVTSPWNSCKTWLYEREAWLKEHFGIPHSHVLAGSAKHLVDGNMLVDDRTETLTRWRDCHQYNVDGSIVALPVLWETPHNRLDGWDGTSTRSWDDVIRWAGCRHQPHWQWDVLDCRSCA
jgi:5'-nucleotidase